MNLRIDNGLVWAEGDLRPASILIGGGRILGLIDPAVASTIPAAEVLDAAGQWILPGGIDMHVHISDGAETFGPGSRCAAAGGITTVLDMAPFHGCVTPRQYEDKAALAAQACVVDFGLIAGIAVTPDDLDHLDELAAMGAPCFKVFMPGQPAVTPQMLWLAMQAAAHSGLRLALHAEETGCLNPVHWDDPLGFAHARPVAAESSATAQAIEMARAAGAPLHICHVSAVDSADLIATGKARGVDVTAEIPPHFLLLNESAFLTQGARVKTTPPLRPAEHAEALWQALDEGVIDVLACDHFLGTLDEVPGDPARMQDAAAGIASLELSLPLIFSQGVLAGRISLERFVEISAQTPALLNGLDYRKGRIAVGLDADLIFVDPQSAWIIEPLGAFSRTGSSPYRGQRFDGRITRTLLRGETIWDGQHSTVDDGYGELVPSKF